MALRWVASGALEASRGFRRLKGYRDIPKLVAALRALDNKIKHANVREVGRCHVVAASESLNCERDNSSRTSWLTKTRPGIQSPPRPRPCT
jgi:hypothetical protein